jgi:hypothetical protein
MKQVNSPVNILKEVPAVHLNDEKALTMLSNDRRLNLPLYFIKVQTKRSKRGAKV